jgi:ribosome biogenesis GTPase A
MEPYWDLVKQIIRESDIVLEILDARAVALSRNEQLEKLLKEEGRPRIFVINKADLATRGELEIAADVLMKGRDISKEYVVYFSNKNRAAARNLLGRIRQIFSKHGKRPDFEEVIKPLIKKPYREAKGDIVVGVVGYPNVGKSCVINALSFKKKAKVSSTAGTTHGIHWISAGNSEIKLIDTPGVIPLTHMEEANLGFIAAKNPERLKEPEITAAKVIEHFQKEKKLANIEKLYNFKVDEENLANPYAILEQLSLAKKHLKKGGTADEKRTAIMLVKDWQIGKLKL